MARLRDEGFAGLEDSQLADEIARQQAAEAARFNELASLFKNKWDELTPFGEFVEVFAELTCAAQEYVREIHGGERSVVSLRDVARCVLVFTWFGKHYACRQNNPFTLEDFFSVKENARPWVRRAAILSLAYCYHARLPGDQRTAFRKTIQSRWDEMQKPLPPTSSQLQFRNEWLNFGGRAEQFGPRAAWLKIDATSFATVLYEAQKEFVINMNLGEGIALNEALLENLFMILISILNHIPIFVIGKPGSSKSLAMNLIQQNLNGDASDNEFLRSLPAVEVFSYQCSPLSTSQGIEQAFEGAVRYKHESPNTNTVVLLDEVGLAEQSPHLPLKVLHKVLDEGKEQAVVGISNWALDPAKMNRAVHLFRPAPGVADLATTAEGMVKTASLKGYLQSLARAYNEVYSTQTQADFWGLREFYSTVRHINRALAKENKSLDGNVIMNSVQRNFGGKPKEMDSVLRVFFNSLGLDMNRVARHNVVELVSQNISSADSRHLMLLTKNNAALSLLFDETILSYERTEVIFGSEFPLDQNDLQVCLNIQRIKLCMAEGIPVVLVHCENLYESLYDLLNQHYTEYGGQLYVRLAFGTHSRLCPIHRNFRIVVVVEKNDAYTRLAPPLLNRFEKQVMERQHLLSDSQLSLVARLRSFAEAFAARSTSDKLDKAVKITTGTDDQDARKAARQAGMKSLRSAFCGYHGDIMSSLVQSLPREDASLTDNEARYQELLRRLLWLATPESVCRLMGSARMRAIQEEYKVDVPEVYFQQQHHGDLAGFCSNVLPEWGSDSSTSLGGAQAMLFTFSPFSLRAGDVIRSQTQWKDVTVGVLHEMSAERDLMSRLNDFFESAKEGSVFLLECDPLAASFRRIMHARYLCESARVKWMKKREEKSDKKDTVPNTPLPPAEPEADGKEADGKEADGKEADGKETDGKEADGKEVDGKDAKDNTPSPADLSKEEHLVLEVHGVHVVLLVHLPRNEYYAFDFDRRWRLAFIDSIEPAKSTGLPSIQAMLGRSMSEIMGTLDMRQVLLRTFRSAMARLVYNHQRTNEDVRRQIVFLLRCLQSDNTFVDLTKKTIADLVQESEISLDLINAAQQEQELLLAGTFQAALHRQIVDIVSSAFALLLSHMDKNSGLYLVGETIDKVRDIWLSLFSRSLDDNNLFMRFNRYVRMVEVHSDGSAGHAFVARFPFSSYICNILQSMRSSVESFGGGMEELLQQQFSLLRFDHGLTGVLSPSLLQRYVYDFTCMVAPHINMMEKETQSKMIWSFITLAGGNKAPTCLSSIHARYWANEFRIHSYLQLLDAVPGAIEPVLKYLTDSATSWGAQLDYDILDLVLHALSPLAQPWRRWEDYALWMNMFGYARPTIDSLLTVAEKGVQVTTSEKFGKKTDSQAVATHAKRSEAEEKLGEKVGSIWEKVRFYQTFIRDIAIPLKLAPELTLETLQSLERESLRTQATLRTLLRVVADLNRKYSRMGQDVECDICLRIPHDPVRFCGRQECRRLLCRACAENFLRSHSFQESKECFWCRQTTDCRIVEDKDAQLLVDQSKGKERQLQAAASRLMEFFIFDFCVSNANAKLEPGLIADLITLLAKKSLKNIGDQSQYYLDVVPSDAARVALLRAMLELRDSETSKVVQASLVSELAESMKEFASLDNALAVCYASVQEELLSYRANNISDAIALVDSADGALLALEKDVQGGEAILHALQTVAHLRRAIVIYAEGLCKFLDNSEMALSTDAKDQKAESNAKTDAEERKKTILGLIHLQRSLDRLLAVGKDPKTVNRLPEMLLRSLRMFLLKNLERRRGLSFVRSALQQVPIADSKWLSEWKSSGDAGLIRFLGCNKLPRTNPFLLEPLYSEVHTAVCATLTPTAPSFSAFENVLRQYSGAESPHLLKQFKAAILSALFHECYLLQVLKDIPVITISRVAGLRAWLNTSSLVAQVFDKDEKSLLQFFTGGANKGKMAAHLEPIHKLLVLSPDSSPEHIALVRLICHVAIVAMRAENSDWAAWLRTAILHPKLLVQTYFPGMPEDVQSMAVRVLGGRWYKCPNGHAYFVDMCGRPTVIQKCATCKVDIGGLDHNLLNSNKDLDEKLEGNTNYGQRSNASDKSEANYCFRRAQEDGAEASFESVRGLPPTAVRIMRFIMHAAFAIGVATLGDSWCENSTNLLNTTYIRLRAQEIPLFFAEHLSGDWKVLKQMVRRSDDDVAIIMHEVIRQLSSEEQQDAGKDLTTLKAMEHRSEWENTISSKVIHPTVIEDNLVTRLENIVSQTSKDLDEGEGVFVSELCERMDVERMEPSMRKQAQPTLWRFRRPFSPDDFIMELNLNAKNEASFPVLSAFMAEEAQLRALKYLPAVIEWQYLLFTRYNRCLDYDTATRLTAQEVISSAPDRNKWAAAFEGYKEAWNLSWKFVDRFGCLPIPTLYKSMVMDFNTPITFSLPAEKDEGICPLALTRFLAEKHNRFVERVDELLLMRGLDHQRQTGKGSNTVISSKFFSASHALSYELKSGFLRYVEKQCVNINLSGQMEYDFANAEQYLIDVYLSGRPLIDMEVRMFSYTDAGGASLGAGGPSGHLSLQALKQKVRQEPLAPDITQAILKEIGSPSVARSILDSVLENAIVFLTAIGGVYVQKLDVGDVHLASYIKDVLMMDDNNATQSSPTLMREVKLKHLESCYKLLRDYCVVDVFATVRPKYRAQVEEKLASKLVEVSAKMDLSILLPVLKDFITTQCIEEHMAGDANLKATVGYLEANDAWLNDLSFFADYFPEELMMKHIMHVYHLLEAQRK